MTPPLLRTKIRRPPVRQDLLDRDNLYVVLDSALQASVTVVSAPAGFGKSTLVGAWASRRGVTTAWYACDAADGDAIMMLRYIVAAIRTVKPDLAGHAERTLEAPPVDVAVVIADLVDELMSIDEDLVLVIDDVHLLADDVTSTVLGPLVAFDVPRLHLVLIGRADPPLPLARLRARGRLCEIRAVDLRLERELVGPLFTKGLGLQLTNEQAGILYDKTEGWLAGLHLAGLSLRGRNDADAAVAALADSDQFILDYLLADVLESLPVSLRHRLLRMSVLERFTADLVSVVTGEDGANVISELEHRNLFVVRLDHDGTWYRFHHLFADLLDRHLRRRHPDDVDDVLAIAGYWFARQELTSEAVRCVEQIRDEQRAVTVMRELWTASLADQEAVVLLQRLVSMPPMIRDHDIRIQVLLTNVAFQTLRFELVAEIERNLERLVDDPGIDPTVKTYVTATIQALNSRTDGPEGYLGAVEHHRRAVALLQGIDDGDALRVGIRSDALRESTFNHQIYIARNLHGLGRIQEASEHLMNVRRTTVGPLPVNMDAIIEQDLFRGAMLTGDFRDVERSIAYIERLQHNGELVMSGPHEVDYVTLRVRYAFDIGNQHLADRLLQDAYAVEARNRFVTPVRLFNAYMVDLRLRIQQGAWDRVDELLRITDGLHYPTLVEYYREVVRTMQAYVGMVRGDMEQLRAWMVRCEADQIPGWRRPTNQILGRLTSITLYMHGAARLGQIEHCQSLFDDAMVFAQQERLYRVQTELLLAMALGTADTHPERASRDLLKAVDIIDKTHCLAPIYTCQDKVHVIVALRDHASDRHAHHDAVIDRWLGLIGHHGVTADHRSTVAATGHGAEVSETMSRPDTGRPPRERTRSDVRDIGLTTRERDTLELLVQGLPNQRIAERLYVSVATVKTHLYNVYQKLGVTTRSEAIIKARDIGFDAIDT